METSGLFGLLAPFNEMSLTAVLLVTFCCGPLVEARTGNILGRIYGGAAALDANFPWMASISRNDVHMCGGSIINRRTILTAGHCVYQVHSAELSIRVGSKRKSSGGQVIAVDDAVHHASYDSYSKDYDIGIIRLSRNIIYSNDVQRTDLPRKGENPQVNTAAYVSGWGFTEHGPTEHLHYVTVEIVDQDTCRRLLARHLLTERMLCAGYMAGGRDHCHNDSGGPLVVNGTLTGIVSWAASEECAQPYQPSVYTRVVYFLDWIESYLSKFNEKL